MVSLWRTRAAIQPGFKFYQFPCLGCFNQLCPNAWASLLHGSWRDRQGGRQRCNPSEYRWTRDSNRACFLHFLAGTYLALQVFLFVQQSSSHAWSDPQDGRVKRGEPGDQSCSGNLPQASQLRYLHIKLQLFWEIKRPDWSKLPSADTRHASKMQLGNEFPLL